MCCPENVVHCSGFHNLISCQGKLINDSISGGYDVVKTNALTFQWQSCDYISGSDYQTLG